MFLYNVKYFIAEFVYLSWNNPVSHQKLFAVQLFKLIKMFCKKNGLLSAMYVSLLSISIFEKYKNNIIVLM